MRTINVKTIKCENNRNTNLRERYLQPAPVKAPRCCWSAGVILIKYSDRTNKTNDPDRKGKILDLKVD